MTQEDDAHAAERSTVRRLILELAAERGYPGPMPSDDLPLHEIGFDSLLTIRLVAALEDQFEIEFPDSALNLESFATIESTMRLVGGSR